MEMEKPFLDAVEKTLRFEGGYAMDSADPGGETKFGISARSYPHLNIRELTREKAIEIYYVDYWQKGGYAMFGNPELGGKLFDLGVNMGPGTAVRLLQRALNKFKPGDLTEDGRLGVKTLESANEFPMPALLMAELRLTAVAYYADLAVRKNMGRFLAGWVRRALA